MDGSRADLRGLHRPIRKAGVKAPCPGGGGGAEHPTSGQPWRAGSELAAGSHRQSHGPVTGTGV